MSERRCRWGILGTAGIARKNWHAIRNCANATLVSVASRQRSRGTQFVDECQTLVPFPQPPRVCGYEELLSSGDIDAVYLPLPTVVRREWVLRAAEAGKHVLCEKPCGVHADDVVQMLAACRDRSLQFMDGVMFLHSKRLPLIRKVLDDGDAVGDIRRIASQFSFRGDDQFLDRNIRVNGELEPLGCLGDLGWYNIRFTLWVMGHRMPERVSGRVLSAVGGSDRGGAVPTEFAGEMFFAEGVSAAFYCSFCTELQQWADICGTRGRLHLSDFVLPYFGSEASFDVHQDHFNIAGCQFNMEHHTQRLSVREYSNNAADAQETNLFRTFSECVLSGRIDPTWGENVLKTQKVLDACLASARSDGRIITL